MSESVLNVCIVLLLPTTRALYVRGNSIHPSPDAPSAPSLRLPSPDREVFTRRGAVLVLEAVHVERDTVFEPRLPPLFLQDARHEIARRGMPRQVGQVLFVRRE